MNAWQQALAVLRRPVAPASPAPEAASQRGGRKFTATPSWEQSQAEVEATLQAMAQERYEAEQTIATAGERREALLMQPDSDDAILALGTEIDRAQLTLERLDRVQPDLQYRLGEIKFHARGARWEALRDDAAKRLEAFLEVEAEYAARRSEWAAIFNEVVEQFPDAAQILPRLCRLTSHTKASFAEQLEAFRTRVIVLARPPMPLIFSLADMIAATRHNGAVPDECAMEWRAECERALTGFVTVEILASYTDRENVTHAKGAKIEMPYEQGTEMVRRGRAILHG